ncbi:toast rack family protein [Acidobacteria bacterium AH-259-G07]|nr:toast rack family protein [Acidobacteria bacterium AH-259-G07]
MRKSLVVSALMLFSSCVLWWDGWDGEEHLVTYQQSEPVQDEELIEAEVELNVGTLQIEAGEPSHVYELDLEYNERAFEPRVQYEREGRVGRFRFELSGEGKWTRRVGKTRLNLRLNPQIPLRLKGRTGVGESEIDLSGMKVERLRLESGVGETKLSMLDPNQTTCESLVIRCGVGALEVTGLGNFAFKDFQFQGGVGGSTLDFSGDWDHVGQVEIEMGVGGVEILLPRHIGAEVRFSKSFLSGLSLSGFEKKSKDTYVSDNMDRVDKVLHLRIRAGIGGVEIRWL